MHVLPFLTFLFLPFLFLELALAVDIRRSSCCGVQINELGEGLDRWGVDDDRGRSRKERYRMLQDTVRFHQRWSISPLLPLFLEIMGEG